MNIEPIVSFFLNNVIWVIPAVLAVIALIQLAYLAVMLLDSEPRQRRQPPAPIMPTQPGVQQRGGAAPELSVPEPIMSAKMVILSGIAGGGEMELPGNQFVIGRFYNPSAQVLIALNERSISRRHAMFRANPAQREYYLSDVGSSYGTSIRKSDHFELITPGREERLFNGDVVQFGMTVTVRFILPGSSRTGVTQL
jgi:hypothetical protein